MKNQINTESYKWVDIIQTRLKIWNEIGDQEYITKCEELLQGWYVFTMHSNPITKHSELIIFNSKINSIDIIYED